MRIYDIITAKQNGEENSAAEIRFLVDGYTQDEIPDYQMAAWLMAVCIRGMTLQETVALTESMIASGDTLDLSHIPGIKVNKHSTGGVGDKTTLVLVPLLAAAGFTVAKMSGRGLGHTGGTLDKLESIPGMSVSLNRNQFLKQLEEVGAAVTGQTNDFVPADKKIYALRDCTATVKCVSLIASSVMSKKIAAGADAILLDVKAGSGAFMKTAADARELAQTMIKIGSLLGKKVFACVTDMSQPLGYAIGNALEVAEAVETLHGRGPSDLQELCLELGAILLQDKIGESLADAKAHLAALINSGAAANKFKQLIAAQGGNPAVVDNPSLLPQAEKILPVKSTKTGYVTAIDTEQLGVSAMLLGAGRAIADDAIDPAAGIIILKKIGETVTHSDNLATMRCGRDVDSRSVEECIRKSYIIGQEPPAKTPLILDKII